MIEVIKTIFVFIFGIIFGSFYACIGYRIPNKISIVSPHSFCPNCKKTLKWYMNIPLFSYIFLKGKCYYCHEKISPLYFITELLTGTLFALSYIYFKLSPSFFIMLTLISALSVTIVTDFKYYYISDRVIVISLIIIFLTHLQNYGITKTLYYVISALIMLIMMYLLKLVGDKIFKRESLGGGDIKLTLVIGLTLGLINGITSLMISSTLALTISLITLKNNKERIIPFGPFLIIGTIIMYILNYNGISII